MSLAGTWLVAFAWAAAAVATGPVRGEPVSLAFDAVDGRRVDLGALRGHTVLIAFWASWCGPCKAEAAALKRLYDREHENGLEIVGVSFDRHRAALEQFVEKHELPWPQHFDGAQGGNRLARGLGVTRIPALWLIDADGVLRDADAASNLEDKVRAVMRSN